MRIKLSDLQVGDIVDITAPGGGAPYDVTGTIVKINKRKETILCQEFINEYHYTHITSIHPRNPNKYVDIKQRKMRFEIILSEEQLHEYYIFLKSLKSNMFSLVTNKTLEEISEVFNHAKEQK